MCDLTPLPTDRMGALVVHHLYGSGKLQCYSSSFGGLLKPLWTHPYSLPMPHTHLPKLHVLRILKNWILFGAKSHKMGWCSVLTTLLEAALGFYRQFLIIWTYNLLTPTYSFNKHLLMGYSVPNRELDTKENHEYSPHLHTSHVMTSQEMTQDKELQRWLI